MDDPIGRFVAEATGPLAKATIRSILTHTSGLGGNYAADEVVDREEAVRAILADHQKRPAKKPFYYTNSGYTLAALIVERASGVRFDSFLRQRLFKPAGMKNTRFWGEIDWTNPNGVAELPRLQPAPVRRATWGYRGGTGIVTTAEDLYRWVRALDQTVVLTAASVRELLDPKVVIRENLSYSLGWLQRKTVRGTRLLWTSGTESFGCSATVHRYLDENLTVIVVTHVRSGSETPAKEIAGWLEKLLLPT